MVLNKKELIEFFELNVPENGYAELEGSMSRKNDFSIRDGITKQVLISDYTEEIEVKVTFTKEYEPNLSSIFSEGKKDIPPEGSCYSNIVTNFPSYPGEPPEPPDFEKKENKMTIPEYDQCACGERGPHSHDAETNRRIEKEISGGNESLSECKFTETNTGMAMADKIREIEQLKMDGSIKAIRERIHAIQFKITSCAVWNKVATDTRYVRLGSAINQVREMLDEIELLLAELNKIQPGNK